MGVCRRPAGCSRPGSPPRADPGQHVAGCTGPHGLSRSQQTTPRAVGFRCRLVSSRACRSLSVRYQRTRVSTALYAHAGRHGRHRLAAPRLFLPPGSSRPLTSQPPTQRSARPARCLDVGQNVQPPGMSVTLLRQRTPSGGLSSAGRTERPGLVVPEGDAHPRVRLYCACCLAQRAVVAEGDLPASRCRGSCTPVGAEALARPARPTRRVELVGAAPFGRVERRVGDHQGGAFGPTGAGMTAPLSLPQPAARAR
jgi:hypothetical protein